MHDYYDMTWLHKILSGRFQIKYYKFTRWFKEGKLKERQGGAVNKV